MNDRSQRKGVKCDPDEIALKGFFLGPQAENGTWVAGLIQNVFERWIHWRRSLFSQDGRAISRYDQESESFAERRRRCEDAVRDLLTRFEKEVPKFSPRYVGHMFSETSLPALYGHIVTLLHNPNNISGESSRVGTEIENEAVGFLLRMCGVDPMQGTGHFTSGGTIANLEALIRARSRMSLWLAMHAAVHEAGGEASFDSFRACHSGWKAFDDALALARRSAVPHEAIAAWNFTSGSFRKIAERLERSGNRRFDGPVILVPENRHYSWQKGCLMLGLGSEPLWSIRLDSEGRLSVEHLRELIVKAIETGRPIMQVVSVVGTTELGGIDPVHRVQDLLDEFKASHSMHIWHHVDAAYGGFFRTVDSARSKTLSQDSLDALQAISRADSVTLDPHKLGYVPYASGAFLTKDRRDYYFSTFEDAPYIDFDASLDRGPYTIEGSRSAAGAVATWMTAQTMGLDAKGYGLLLERTIRIKRELSLLIQQAGVPVRIAPGCDTNILCFSCARPGDRLSEANRKTLKIYEEFSPKKNGEFIVSKTALHWDSYSDLLETWTRNGALVRDVDEVVLIRMTLMNPFFASVETDVNYAELFVKLLADACR